MTCRELVDFLADYLDGSLPADLRSHFEKHLDVCPPCVAYLKTYNSGYELAQAAFGDDCCEVAADLVNAIVNARKK